jgi:hypothetical protein
MLQNKPKENNNFLNFFSFMWPTTSGLSIPTFLTKYKANIIKSKDSYSQHLSNLTCLKIPNTAWSFDIYITVKVEEIKSYAFLYNNNDSNIYYTKYHLQGVKTNDNKWHMVTNKLNCKYYDPVSFSITKEGQIQYASEKDFEIRYRIELL